MTFEEVLGPEHVFTARARAELGKTLLAMGKRSRAAESLEHAVASLLKGDAAAALVGDLQFFLAKAIDGPGAARERALALTREGIAGMESSPDRDEALLLEARAFLAERER